MSHNNMLVDGSPFDKGCLVTRYKVGENGGQPSCQDFSNNLVGEIEQTDWPEVRK